MIYIKKGILECELIGLTPLLKQQLKASLSYEDKNHIIAKAVARKKFGYVPKRLASWSGITYLIDDNNKIPTGLLSRVLNILEATGEEVQYLEEPLIPEAAPIELINPPNFWQHQIDAVESIKQNITGMIRAGTGAGKSIMSVKATAEIGQWPYLFIVNRISLLTQTHNVYSKYFNETIGWIGDGKIDVQRINIASIGTLCSILKIKTEKDDENLNYTGEQIKALKKLLKECKFVVVDENHHGSADTYKKVMNALPNAIYRIGLSATPFRTDGNDILLEAAFGQIIYSKSASELIRDGILCQPEIYFVQYDDPYLTKKYPKNAKGGVYNSIYKTCVVENVLLNTIIAKLAIVNAEMKRLTLISVKQVKHGQYIYDIMKELKPELNIEFLHGKNKDILGEEKIKEEFASGKIKVLISTLFDEGTDIPRIDAIIDAGGGRSAIKALQLVGRGIRKYPGKNKAHIFMFSQPYQFLYKHANARAQILQTEEAFNLQVLDWDSE